MSNGVTFYTPGTGLPDFEMRIALGLCAAALNVVEPEKVFFREEFDRYEITVLDGPDVSAKIQNSLGWLCQNRLADQALLLRTPGFRPLHLDKQAKGVAAFGVQLSKTNHVLQNVFNDKPRIRMGAHDFACLHTESKEPPIFGALLAFSPYLGQPPKRNNPTNQTTLPICPYCSVTGLAGTVGFQIDLSISHPDRSKKERYFFLPRFASKVEGTVLARYISATKHIRGNIEDIPSSAATIGLLSLYPHVVDSLYDAVDTFYVGRLDSSGNAPRYGYVTEQPISKTVQFLLSVYNRALVQKCYRMDTRSELLGFLAKAFQNKDGKAALDFARSYVGATDAKSMLPPTAAEFISREVYAMDRSLLEGEKFRVIKEVADMLQYFVRERNFGFVDNLRKARDIDEFMKLFLDAQREAQSAVLDPKKQYKPFLPSQATQQQVLLLANESENQFRAIQTLIALMAFTYFRKED
jgi:hypothetical protein